MTVQPLKHAYPMSETQRAVLWGLEDGPRTAAELADWVGIRADVTRHRLISLLRRGLVKVVGERTATRGPAPRVWALEEVGGG